MALDAKKDTGKNKKATPKRLREKDKAALRKEKLAKEREAHKTTLAALQTANSQTASLQATNAALQVAAMQNAAPRVGGKKNSLCFQGTSCIRKNCPFSHPNGANAQQPRNQLNLQQQGGQDFTGQTQSQQQGFPWPSFGPPLGPPPGILPSQQLPLSPQQLSLPLPHQLALLPPPQGQQNQQSQQIQQGQQAAGRKTIGFNEGLRILSNMGMKTACLRNYTAKLCSPSCAFRHEWQHHQVYHARIWKRAV